MGVSIWDAADAHSMDRWALTRADFQAPWHGVLDTVWLLCYEAQLFGCPRGQEDFRAGVARRHPVTACTTSSTIASMRRCEHCSTRQECSTLLLDGPRLRWLFATLLAQDPSPGQLGASSLRRVMSAFFVTQGVGDTWATCPTLFRGIWTWSKMAGFSFLVVGIEDCLHGFCSVAL